MNLEFILSICPRVSLIMDDPNMIYTMWMKPYHTGVVSFVSVSKVQKSEALMLMILWLDVFYSANKAEVF